MRLRIAVAAFAAAFCIATAVAAVTTVHEIKTHTSSLARPIARI